MSARSLREPNGSHPSARTLPRVTGYVAPRPLTPGAGLPWTAGTARPVSAEPVARPAVIAEPRRAYHVGVAVGLTTGAYALALLAVTQVQAERDNAQIAERAPAVQAIDMLGAHHDQMSSQLEQARQRYLAGAAVYNDLVGQLSDVDQGIADLNATLAQIEAMGTGAYGIPTGPITITRSGGGTTSKGSTKTTAPALAPPPAAAPPPPTTATSGASGG